ncbi:hypothetical protein CEXT_508431 [Caerostris extrusa]|uniref:Uncharacterized protein n=1 Tax=Caerostris extrusa TaxID=172846 RepID=A0AAV4WJ52_CAEEX|nr:hypothetical protein CEXT_508431 [Caerostris extrusa]
MLMQSIYYRYHAEEQQQIVNMLREVNMRHEMQLRRDMAARNERPFSDDSMSSNVDQGSSDGLQHSWSSDDEDDGIVVLVSPEGDVPPSDQVDPDDTKELGNDYLEKSTSDYFEEFQSIFTVSPEKNIINTLTKECLKESAKSDTVNEETQTAVLNTEEDSLNMNKHTEITGNAKGIDTCAANSSIKNADDILKINEKALKIGDGNTVNNGPMNKVDVLPITKDNHTVKSQMTSPDLPKESNSSHNNLNYKNSEFALAQPELKNSTANNNSLYAKCVETFPAFIKGNKIMWLKQDRMKMFHSKEIFIQLLHVLLIPHSLKL